MRTQRVVLGTVLALSGALSATDVRAQRAASFAIRHVRVFDGDSLLRGRATVVVRDGIIQAVFPGDTARIPADLIALDGSGTTLLPGLIDAHTHTVDAEQLRLALTFGVTTCLDMNTAPDVVPGLREAAATRSDVADFRSAGTLATAPGGHGTERGRAIPTVSDVRAVERFVAARKREGSDYLKIVLSGVRAARAGVPTLSPDMVKALVMAGHWHHLLVVAHIESADDARTVAEAGGDGLAHGWRDRGAVPELAALIAKRGMFVIPTLAIADAYLGGAATLAADPRLRPYLPDSIAARLATPPAPSTVGPIEQFYDVTRSLRDAGVRLVAGTDAGAYGSNTAHGVSLHRELELYVKAGLTPAEALHAATAAAADAFGLADRGRIAPGRRADLILVRGDPTADITATRDLLRVWKAGVVLQRVSLAMTGERH